MLSLHAHTSLSPTAAVQQEAPSQLQAVRLGPIVNEVVTIIRPLVHEVRFSANKGLMSEVWISCVLHHMHSNVSLFAGCLAHERAPPRPAPGIG